MPRKPKPTPCPDCALTVTPNPIPLQTESIEVTGVGFGAYAEPRDRAPDGGIWIATPQDISSHHVAVNADGTFSFTYSRLWHIPDTSGAQIRAYDNAGKLPDGLLAAANITVV